MEVRRSISACNDMKNRFDQEYWLQHELPRRLHAVAAVEMAAEIHLTSPERFEIRFDGKLRIRGLPSGFFNPVLEAGVLHGRALLEFLGLKTPPSGEVKLVPRKSKDKKPDDVVIEMFQKEGGEFLQKVTPAQVRGRYPSDPDLAERALAGMIIDSNKLLAHCTLQSGLDARDQSLLIACAGVLALVRQYVYRPLNRPVPSLGFTLETNEEG